jgi:hypothetical protein
MPNAAVVRFHKDDPGFRRWWRANSSGYVLNLFGGDPRDNILHRASCDRLPPTQPNAAWTSVPKICCGDRTVLEAEADRLRGGRGPHITTRLLDYDDRAISTAAESLQLVTV